MTSKVRGKAKLGRGRGEGEREGGGGEGKLCFFVTLHPFANSGGLANTPSSHPPRHEASRCSPRPSRHPDACCLNGLFRPSFCQCSPGCLSRAGDQEGFGASHSCSVTGCEGPGEAGDPQERGLKRRRQGLASGWALWV